MSTKPHILLIYTGGTIGMMKDYASNALKAFDFSQLLDKIPEICHILKYVDHFLLLNGLNISNWQANLWVGFFSFFSPKKEK